MHFYKKIAKNVIFLAFFIKSLYNQRMPDTEKRELLGRLKAWMVLHQKTRKDVADALGVSLPTVNGWYSKNAITSAKAAALEELIREKKPETAEIRIKKTMEIDGSLAEEIESMAVKLGVNEVDVVRAALIAYSKQVMGGSN